MGQYRETDDIRYDYDNQAYIKTAMHCPDCNTPFKDDAQGFASWNSELFWCERCQEWK